ncbi:MAG TPA: FKBP-type peptidyl-prolyl cis-trans isomerase [Solirubrobacterales bacterium]|jgi:FKBP-type peptidyl-prolyl cis-trans isomerase|nr:FKBP-type peptidyl-prolyl cis-trans isomerase [Solirubrobacterales bacterium]
MKSIGLIFALCVALALAVAGCGGSSSSTGSTESESTATAESTATTESTTATKKTKPKVTVPNGAPPKKLEIKEIEEGSGAEAKSGDEVTVQYVGVGYDTKEEFDSSWSRNEPFTFGLGAGQVIAGWDQGVEGMKVGGRRELIIPPELAYGAAPPSPAIGKNETLIFVIDLLAVK